VSPPTPSRARSDDGRRCEDLGVRHPPRRGLNHGQKPVQNPSSKGGFSEGFGKRYALALADARNKPWAPPHTPAPLGDRGRDVRSVISSCGHPIGCHTGHPAARGEPRSARSQATPCGRASGAAMAKPAHARRSPQKRTQARRLTAAPPALGNTRRSATLARRSNSATELLLTTSRRRAHPPNHVRRS
jgi:hypothetical protein